MIANKLGNATNIRPVVKSKDKHKKEAYELLSSKETLKSLSFTRYDTLLYADLFITLDVVTDNLGLVVKVPIDDFKVSAYDLGEILNQKIMRPDSIWLFTLQDDTQVLTKNDPSGSCVPNTKDMIEFGTKVIAREEEIDLQENASDDEDDKSEGMPGSEKKSDKVAQIRVDFLIPPCLGGGFISKEASQSFKPINWADEIKEELEIQTIKADMLRFETMDGKK